jgi:hypothetical protein
MKKYLKILTVLIALSASYEVSASFTVQGMPLQLPSEGATVSFKCINKGECFTMSYLGGGQKYIGQ